MNHRHEKNLRSMLGVEDAGVPLSDEVKYRVELMETRMTRFFGHFTEMQAEVLACVVNDLDDEQILVLPVESLPQSLEERVEKMSRNALRAKLEELGVSKTIKYSTTALRKKLLDKLTEQEAKTEQKVA